MMRKVINNNGSIDHLFSETAFHSREGLQMFANKVQVKASNVQQGNDSCCIHDIVATKGWNMELTQIFPMVMHAKG